MGQKKIDRRTHYQKWNNGFSDLPSPFVLAMFARRERLGEYLKCHRLTNTVIEIGVHQAVFAKGLLRLWPGKYFGVDPWQEVLLGYDDKLSNAGPTREHDYRTALRQLEPYKDRVQLIRKTSQEAVHLFPDGCADMVYIDGNHEEEYVRQDVNNYWAKVRSGGILAGHDILYPRGKEVEYRWRKGIEAVLLDKFSDRHIYVIPEPGYPWSWFVHKGFNE